MENALASNHSLCEGKEGVCVQGMVLVLPPAFRSGAVSVKILLLHHRGSFHFLPAAWPGPGPQVEGKEVFPTPTPPLTSAQPSCARRVGCTFPYLQHKTSLFLHPGHVHAQLAREGRWGRGDHPAGALVTHIRLLLLSHAVWGSSLCLIQWG